MRYRFSHHHVSRFSCVALTAIATACGGPASSDPDVARMIQIGPDELPVVETEAWTSSGGSSGYGDTETTAGGDASVTTSGIGTDGTWSTTWIDPSTSGGGSGTGGHDTGSYGSDGSGTGGGDTAGGTGGGGDTAGGEGGTQDSGESGGTCNAGAPAYVKPANYPAGYPHGWINKIHLDTCTQCNFQNWVDSDGVDPETPGCHQAYETLEIDPALVAVVGGAGVLLPICSSPTNDRFGEQCEADGDTLLETNPGKGVCHAHPIGDGGVGVGHPDRFSCNAYCSETYGLPGTCQVATNACQNGVDSAYCQCGC